MCEHLQSGYFQPWLLNTNAFVTTSSMSIYFSDEGLTINIMKGVPWAGAGKRMCLVFQLKVFIQWLKIICGIKSLKCW
jgi:hypothetical protein